MATNKYFVCPYCNKKFTREDLVIHLRNKHSDLLPEGFTPLRTAFHIVNGKDFNYARKCRICKKPTSWDEAKGRYDFMCGSKLCHDKYVEIMRENMGEKCGINRQTKTAEGLKKMLANRRISGKYQFQDGTEVDYTGSYEKKALEFFDNVMEIKASDLMIPGPVLTYMLDGVQHFYIPDMFYIPYNLIIEVKDGGDRPNKNPQWVETRKKQIAKEEYIIKYTDFNYIRLTNNDFSQILAVFADLKMSLKEYNGERVIHVNENSDIIHEYGLIFNKNDLCLRLDDFESGKSNVLLVTGYSGSGKSTLASELAKKYKCDYFELDALNFYIEKYMTIDDAKNGEPALVDFINSKKLEQKSLSHEEYGKLYEEYIKFLVSWCKNKKDKKFIIEGLQIYEVFNEKKPQSFIISNPIIIKGTSGLVSAIRGAKRNSEDGDNKFFKEFKGLLGWVLKDRKMLKNLIKSVNENMVSTIHSAIPPMGDNDLVLVQYLQNNVFANSTRFGISNTPKLDKIFIRDDFDCTIKDVDKSFLEECKYSTFIIKDKKSDILSKISKSLGKEVDEDFITEVILGHKLYTTDQLQFESCIILYEDFYYNSQRIEENCLKYILDEETEVNVDGQ